ncbi:hypothetical protein RchiOBHm_Chr1g0356501 [Rosa chinensis]|uniref:Uncharacterized protein n=1 Tax=Rosa chinensis TaxID=74649 RepID=A0A2P6SHR9_ROSCH|nr:hypothetical protein RchiOBHm_Chr1g0356501 [Rosa chinensis]
MRLRRYADGEFDLCYFCFQQEVKNSSAKIRQSLGNIWPSPTSITSMFFLPLHLCSSSPASLNCNSIDLFINGIVNPKQSQFF